MARCRRSSLVAGALAALGALATGCVTTPLEQRTWYEVRTPHHHILSALGPDETSNLAISLERNRATVEFLWAGSIPAAREPTRVLAFDDRGIGRPFAYGSDRSYLLTGLDRDTIVLRTGGGWEGDGRETLKREIAHRLLARVAADDDPPWLREGLSRLASTLQIRGPGAWLGDLPRDAHATLLEGHWVSFDRMLAAADLADWPRRDRDLFEVEAWALCHYLWTDAERRHDTADRLIAFRRALRSGAAPAEAAASSLGTDLQREVWRHLTAHDAMPTLMVRIRLDDSPERPTPAPQDAVLLALAELALEIDNAGRAQRYAEQAAESDPASPRAQLALGRIAERDGDPAEADRAFDAALASAPGDASLHVARGNLLRERAAREADPAARRDLVVRARAHYDRAIGLAPERPSGHAGLAATHLVEGEDARRGLDPVLRALALLPGDTRLRALHARLALAAGDVGDARGSTVRLITDAQSDEELAEARALLEEIEATP